ncbi:complement C1r subcomponent [Dipodomys spectabilis]|uniref:complement C1r subcomponent n=1 Tax=Dipodomys spectabilis TaxID=105255 RepID=UPI001C539D1E|nr:complement C1r subcomponent [Dipodomys spectabilis]
MWLALLWVSALLGGAGGSSPQKLFGTVTSPRYPKPYPNNVETTTVIEVPRGYRVKLVFRMFDVEPSEACFYDYVKISADKKSLGRFCGHPGSPRGRPPGRTEFLSLGNRMLLTFHTDFSNEENGTAMFYKGFLAYYQAVDLDECTAPPSPLDGAAGPRCQQLCHNYVGGYFCSCRAGYELQKDGSCRAECSRELHTEPSGVISSLEYPRPYPPDLRCNYSIRVDRGFSLHLKFMEPFDIDDHQQVHCPYDQLQIYARGKRLGEFCGKQRPPDLDVSSNAVDVVFFTDESGDSRGWKLRYTTQTVKCPQPKALDDFTIIEKLKLLYEYRDYFVATCKQGYQLVKGDQVLSSFSATCGHDGTWDRAMPRCKIRDCGPPRALPNGDFRYVTAEGVSTYQAQIQYHCREPYYAMSTREGRSEAQRGAYTCTAQGIWKNEEEGEKMPRCLPVCGKPVHPVREKQRIIGGHTAELGNFPWQAYTHIYGRGGGALLGDRWVLTAAHTLAPKDYEPHDAHERPPIDVFLGHTNEEEIKRLGVRRVRRVHVHPDYRQDQPHNFEGDLALLELESRVPLGPHLLPICLPDNETLYDPGLVGFVSGFGLTRDKIAFDLRFVRLPVAQRGACETWLRSKRSHDVFSHNMFCAGDPRLRQDACQGDSGGVFAARDHEADRWVATGIVSWGIGCGRGYGFYTKLLSYVEWIQKVMGEEEEG